MAHKHGAATIRHIIATLGLTIADQGTGTPEDISDINEALLNYIDTGMVIADLAARKWDGVSCVAAMFPRRFAPLPALNFKIRGSSKGEVYSQNCAIDIGSFDLSLSPNPVYKNDV